MARNQKNVKEVIGTVSPVPMGDWSSLITYKKLNFVTHNDVIWFAKRTNKGIEPGVTENWDIYWMRGITGGNAVQPDGTYPDMTVGTAQVAERVSHVLTITRNGREIGTFDGSETANLDLSEYSAEILLVVGDWVDNRQEVEVEGITTTNNVAVYPFNGSAAEYILSNILVSQGEGKLIFTCTSVPQKDLLVMAEY